MDEHSDLDLVIAVDAPSFDEVMQERRRIAAGLGTLLAAFTGEHVGEPRVLICLYDNPLLHVDLKFVNVEQMGHSVDRPAVLWERSGEMSAALKRSFAGYPEPDAAWIEERFWTWVHYGVSKVKRGELYEALDLISFLRARVLGPLILAKAGGKPAGVRRIEAVSPGWADELRKTVAAYEPQSCLRAIASCAAIYRMLRSETWTVSPAESAALRYLQSACGVEVLGQLDC